MTLYINTNSVNVSVTDSVATVTLNRPRVHNAWDDTLGAGLERAFTALSADEDVRRSCRADTMTFAELFADAFTRRSWLCWTPRSR
jgi:hypothetical protein